MINSGNARIWPTVIEKAVRYMHRKILRGGHIWYYPTGQHIRDSEGYIVDSYYHAYMDAASAAHIHKAYPGALIEIELIEEVDCGIAENLVQ